MRISIPSSVGELSGWMMISACVGIGLREIFPWLSLASSEWMILLIGFSILVVLMWEYSRFTRSLALIVLAFFLGVWRVDIAPPPRVYVSNGSLMRVTSHSPGVWPWSWLQQYRSYLTSRINRALPEREATLVSGILYGDGIFSKQDKELFRSAGIMHIVAVSGSNVTVVVEFIILAMLTLNARRRVTFCVTSFALLLFTGFVGFSASVVRAALMAWLVLVAREVGRIPSSFRSLLVVGVFLLLIDPWALRYDIGFALSFLAMWGILAWVPLFQLYLRWLPERFFIRTSVAMTLAATLMTAPYIAWIFHRVSLAGLFTNVLILPLVPFIMLWGAGVMVLGQGPFGLFAIPVIGLTRLVFWFAELSNIVPWLEIQSVSVSGVVICSVYVILLYLWLILRKKLTYQQGEGAV
ncbi:ComEC/Rec2 family competence protein [Patescibacteria group bacterium]|nr:ComEC/Rec2 family competence protein [Patescibacteria group bacterium]